MIKETDIFLLSIKDFFTSKMLKFSLLPIIITVTLMYILFFIVAEMGLEHLGTMDVQSTQTTIENGIPHTESFSAQLQGTAMIQFLMSYAITSWIATFLVYAIGGFLVIYASIFIAVIIIGFLTPYILKEIQNRHYRDVEMLGDASILSGIFLLLKSAIIMIFLFILFIPFYFIPLINIIAFNLPLYYFFHKMITFDISSNICTDAEDKKIRFFNKNSLRAKTFALYLTSLIPFAIFLGAVFYVIYLGHTYFAQVKSIRHTSPS